MALAGIVLYIILIISIQIFHIQANFWQKFEFEFLRNFTRPGAQLSKIGFTRLDESVSVHSGWVFVQSINPGRTCFGLVKRSLATNLGQQNQWHHQGSGLGWLTTTHPSPYKFTGHPTGQDRLSSGQLCKTSQILSQPAKLETRYRSGPTEIASHFPSKAASHFKSDGGLDSSCFPSKAMGHLKSVGGPQLARGP